MNKNVLEYKGYHTKIEYDAESSMLHGKVEGINDFVNFESDSAQTIEKEFHNAVDDYLEFCEEVGKEPEKEYKGLFNVRIAPELHKKLAMKAYINGESLNRTVEKAIEAYVVETTESDIQLVKSIKVLASMFGTKNVPTQRKLTIAPSSNIIPFEMSSHINVLYN